MMTNLILLVSGKRKSGKDYICEKLKSILGEEKCTIIRISEPLKRCYAKDHNLDLIELMSNGVYKEKHRRDMINWSDDIRRENPGYFCKAACDAAPSKALWIVSDVRRKTDIAWFKETYGEKIRTIRISADLQTRTDRGWTFSKGVDDVVSECDLDHFVEWDLLVENNSSNEAEKAIKTILNVVAESAV